MKKIFKLCIVGFGNSAKEFCRMAINKRLPIKIVGIATKSKGNLLNKEGIDIENLLREVEEFGVFLKENPSRVEMNTIDIIKNSGADVMIELSTLSIEDGEPAISHIETAFENNMDVITANKGPIAWDFHRLNKIAQEKKKRFLYETTVMDGTPVFNLVKYTLMGCNVLSFRGILNSTTNFILEEMEKGNTYEEAIKEAQRRGFAEANPSVDVEGWDAAAKTAALANVLLDGKITPMTVERIGIEHITKEQIEGAKAKGMKYKLLCEGGIIDGIVYGKVYPKLIKDTDMFSTIDSTSSLLSITTDLMGEICIVEKNPEIQQTAYGIYSDLMRIMTE